MKRIWQSIATRFIPQLLAVSLKQYNRVKTELEEQKLVTESWREYWRIKKAEYDAFQDFWVSVKRLDLDNLTKDEIVDKLNLFDLEYREACIFIKENMWNDKKRRETLSHAFKIFSHDN